MIRVVIADDQRLLRESFKSLIEQDDEITVVGCAQNGREALELCEQFHPDIVLMDVKMPECDGIEGTRLIKAGYSGTKVLILTTFEDDKNIYEAIKNGADGYILKEITPEDLIDAIRNTVKGFGIFSKTSYNVVVRQVVASNEVVHFQETNAIKDFNLKEREVEIIRMISEGKSNREIAAKLFLSEGRIKNILSELFSKLDLEDRNQLASFGRKNGLI